MAATEARREGTTPANSAQDFWSANPKFVDRAVSILARRKRLSTAQAQDLNSEVWLKLLSSPAAAHRFEGRSSLVAYLVSIANRVLLDLRIKEMGKWRPTAHSRQLGPVAIELDRMVRRDGHGSLQAVEALRARGLTLDPQHVDSIVNRGSCRRAWVDPSILESMPSSCPQTDHLVVMSEERRVASHAVVALSQALARIPREDRTLLHRRFIKGQTVADIADGDRDLQKKLYRRIDRTLSALRSLLEDAGVSDADVRGLVIGDLTNVECGSGFSTRPAQ